MATHNLYVYLTKEDQERLEALKFLSRESGWTLEEMTAFAKEHDKIIFNKVTRDRALELIREANDVGLSATVGHVAKKYLARFKKFEEGYVKTWNWPGALFTWIWLVIKGMWPKLAFYWVIFTAFNWIVPDSFQTITWLASCIYFGLFANYDYYLHAVRVEPLWPEFPYNECKTPFWIIITLIFLIGLGGAVYKSVTTVTKTAKAPSIQTTPVKSFDTKNYSFKITPENWQVFLNPPVDTPLIIYRRIEEKKLSEQLSFGKREGIPFLANIQSSSVEKNFQKKSDLGLLMILDVNPSSLKPNSADEKGVFEEMYSAIYGKRRAELSLKLRRLISEEELKPSYEEINGQLWGHTINTLDRKYPQHRVTTHLGYYWTVANNKIIAIATQAFEPYKSEVESQTRTFLESFKVHGSDSV